MADGTSFQTHYQQVQALSQITQAQTISPTPLELPSFNTLIIACTLFAASLVIAAIYLIQRHTNDLKHILISISLAVGVSTIPIAVALAQQSSDIRSQASAVYTPENVIITQPTANSLLITWHTAQTNSGALRLRQNPDQSNQQTIITESADPSTYHQITVNNLKPGTYYFEILSGKYWYDNQGNPLTITIN